MILRGRFTARRKVLAVFMLLILGLLGYAWYAGMAITQGAEWKDMDWNGDGVVGRGEIAEAFYAVAVRTQVDGARRCMTYYWRASGQQIRVDCRTEFKPGKEASKS